MYGWIGGGGCAHNSTVELEILRILRNLVSDNDCYTVQQNLDKYTSFYISTDVRCIVLYEIRILK